MYGLVHLGLREMVVELAGEAGWARIERELGIGPAERLSLAVYDDELTLRILSAVTGLLQLDPEDCLALFGRHWVRFAARGSYASILNFTGQDLETFIANLDRMHQAVRVSMPEAQVPSFRIVDRKDGSLVVRYESVRDGLQSFAHGLLEGLLQRFGLEGTVVRLSSGPGTADFAVSHG